MLLAARVKRRHLRLARQLTRASHRMQVIPAHGAGARWCQSWLLVVCRAMLASRAAGLGYPREHRSRTEPRRRPRPETRQFRGQPARSRLFAERWAVRRGERQRGISTAGPTTVRWSIPSETNPRCGQALACRAKHAPAPSAPGASVRGKAQARAAPGDALRVLARCRRVG